MLTYLHTQFQLTVWCRHCNSPCRWRHQRAGIQRGRGLDVRNSSKRNSWTISRRLRHLLVLNTKNHFRFLISASFITFFFSYIYVSSRVSLRCNDVSDLAGPWELMQKIVFIWIDGASFVSTLVVGFYTRAHRNPYCLLDCLINCLFVCLFVCLFDWLIGRLIEIPSSKQLTHRRCIT